MELKHLLQDEDAVSPVIGVILMVAITVILAAVIGTFVLGLGDQVQSSAPNSNFQFDYSGDFTSDTGEVEITHNGGQDVDDDQLTVQVGSETAYEGPGSTPSVDWGIGTDNWGSTISTGDSLTLTDDATADQTGDTVRIIWQSSSGGSSNTIGESTIPS